jgi:hypothetical protein
MCHVPVGTAAAVIHGTQFFQWTPNFVFITHGPKFDYNPSFPDVLQKSFKLSNAWTTSSYWEQHGYCLLTSKDRKRNLNKVSFIRHQLCVFTYTVTSVLRTQTEHWNLCETGRSSAGRGIKIFRKIQGDRKLMQPILKYLLMAVIQNISTGLINTRYRCDYTRAHAGHVTL